MKLLVLGASGQLGHEVAARARETTGLTVRAPGRDQVDLSDPAGLAARLERLDFDTLVNCAAYTAVDEAETEAGAAFEVNGRAVAELAAVCAGRDARLVQVSTDYVFDGGADRPYPVDAAPGPLNVYGASKLVGEALARRIHPGGTLVVRTSSVFGVAGAERGGNFVETMLRLAAERDRLRVVDDVTMAPTGAADLARAILGLISADAEPGVYHVTNAGRASWHELAVAILERAGGSVAVEPVPSTEYPTPARRPRFSVLDTSKADALVGPLPHWTDALDRYLERRSGRSEPDR